MDQYPPVSKLLTELNAQNPHQGLAQYTRIFTELDIYNIDEITRLGEDKLVSELHMTLGNAAFLFGAVQKEMNHSNGKTKKPHLG